jgi:phage shock protein A
MPLFRRIADIVSANLNEMVERYEDPEKMLRQAVREMERALGVGLDRAVAAVAHEKLLARQSTEHRRQAERWHRRAVAAVEAGDDPLSRRAISRRMEHEKFAARIEDLQAAASDASHKLRRQIEAMREKLSEAKCNLATATVRKRLAQARSRIVDHVPLSASLAGLSNFDRWMDRVEFAAVEAEAWCELVGAADDDLFETLDDARLEQELATLKANLCK